jgi:hypothetical protein
VLLGEGIDSDFPGEFDGDLLIPLGRVREEFLVVDIDGDSCDLSG